MKAKPEIIEWQPAELRIIAPALAAGLLLVSIGVVELAIRQEWRGEAKWVGGQSPKNAAPAVGPTSRASDDPMSLWTVTRATQSTSLPTGRGAWDFGGPEYHGRAAPRFSTSISDDDLEAVTAAWRNRAYAAAAARVMRWSDLQDRRQIILPMLIDWVHANPAEAAQFAQRQSEGAERRESLEAALRAWAEIDLPSATAWLNAQQPQPDYDAAVAVIATSRPLIERCPDVALSWAESIDQPQLRWESTASVVLGWIRRDRAAALNYVEHTASLRSDERSRLLEFVNRASAVVE